MEMVISIPDDVASKLRERAATSGQTMPAYAAKLVTDTLAKPTLDELLAPVRKQVAESGMSEAEVEDFLRDELAAHRRDKKANVNA
jgi:hypothetical protein